MAWKRKIVMRHMKRRSRCFHPESNACPPAKFNALLSPISMFITTVLGKNDHRPVSTDHGRSYGSCYTGESELNHDLRCGQNHLNPNEYEPDHIYRRRTSTENILDFNSVPRRRAISFVRCHVDRMEDSQFDIDIWNDSVVQLEFPDTYTTSEITAFFRRKNNRRHAIHITNGKDMTLFIKRLYNDKKFDKTRTGVSGR